MLFLLRSPPRAIFLDRWEHLLWRRLWLLGLIYRRQLDLLHIRSEVAVGMLEAAPTIGNVAVVGARFAGLVKLG